MNFAIVENSKSKKEDKEQESIQSSLGAAIFRLYDVTQNSKQLRGMDRSHRDINLLSACIAQSVETPPAENPIRVIVLFFSSLYCMVFLIQNFNHVCITILKCPL